MPILPNFRLSLPKTRRRSVCPKNSSLPATRLKKQPKALHSLRRSRQRASAQSADIGAASMCEMVAEIPPAWLLLSETVAGEDIPVTPSEPAEGIEEDIEPSEEIIEEAAEPQPEEAVEETVEPQSEEVVEEAVEPQSEEVVEEAVEPQPEEAVEEAAEPQPEEVVEEAVEEAVEPQPEEAVEETAEPQPDEVAEEGAQPLGEEQVEGND